MGVVDSIKQFLFQRFPTNRQIAWAREVVWWQYELVEARVRAWEGRGLHVVAACHGELRIEAI